MLRLHPLPPTPFLPLPPPPSPVFAFLGDRVSVFLAGGRTTDHAKSRAAMVEIFYFVFLLDGGCFFRVLLGMHFLLLQPTAS